MPMRFSSGPAWQLLLLLPFQLASFSVMAVLVRSSQWTAKRSSIQTCCARTALLMLVSPSPSLLQQDPSLPCPSTAAASQTGVAPPRTLRFRTASMNLLLLMGFRANPSTFRSILSPSCTHSLLTLNEPFHSIGPPNTTDCLFIIRWSDRKLMRVSGQSWGPPDIVSGVRAFALLENLW
ncbi:hypothetical protein DFJ77DRAFT_240845 [Powellomyces hirtus]|nr:hypothetical protein DFJ77DRAFT_240845 [Powellomyces hirtus]